MWVAYGLIVLAVIFFFLGLAGCPFPLGDGIKRSREKQDDAVLMNDDQVATSNPAPPRSELREALSANGVPEPAHFNWSQHLFALKLAERREAVTIKILQDATQRLKHSYCVRCGFPFTGPQNRATCKTSSACDKRLRTDLDQRLRAGSNVPFRVHPDWVPPPGSN
jgi:hypothetical protein